jgi:hypothetical protein
MAKMLRMKPYNFVWELRRGREDSLSPCIGDLFFFIGLKPPNTEELKINWERTLDENNGEFWRDLKNSPNYLPLFIIYTLKTKKILHHKSSLPLPSKYTPKQGERFSSHPLLMYLGNIVYER